MPRVNAAAKRSPSGRPLENTVYSGSSDTAGSSHASLPAASRSCVSSRWAPTPLSISARSTRPASSLRRLARSSTAPSTDRFGGLEARRIRVAVDHADAQAAQRGQVVDAAAAVRPRHEADLVHDAQRLREAHRALALLGPPRADDAVVLAALELEQRPRPGAEAAVPSTGPACAQRGARDLAGDAAAGQRAAGVRRELRRDQAERRVRRRAPAAPATAGRAAAASQTRLWRREVMARGGGEERRASPEGRRRLAAERGDPAPRRPGEMPGCRPRRAAIDHAGLKAGRVSRPGRPGGDGREGARGLLAAGAGGQQGAGAAGDPAGAGVDEDTCVSAFCVPRTASSSSRRRRWSPARCRCRRPPSPAAPSGSGRPAGRSGQATRLGSSRAPSLPTSAAAIADPQRCRRR